MTYNLKSTERRDGSNTNRTRDQERSGQAKPVGPDADGPDRGLLEQSHSPDGATCELCGDIIDFYMDGNDRGSAVCESCASSLDGDADSLGSNADRNRCPSCGDPVDEQARRRYDGRCLDCIEEAHSELLPKPVNRPSEDS